MKPQSLVLSQGIWSIPHLHAFFPEWEIVKKQYRQNTAYHCVMGWGYRPSTKKAQLFAQQNHLPYIALEDGFLRSLGLGVEGYPPYSLIYDDIGIYYDTTRPSRLEQLILTTASLSEEQQLVANRAMQFMVTHKLSKYNHAPTMLSAPLMEDRRQSSSIVLVIDQTFGDMAVKYGSADERHFQQMLACAQQENPEAIIWVKTHPDVLTGKKKGYLTHLTAHSPHIRLIAEDIHPMALLACVDKVYCVTSQMGFEALLLHKPVTTFGVPWYAGWGLTDDRHPFVMTLQKQHRRQARSLLSLFFSAYIAYARYIHPITAQQGSIMDVLYYLQRLTMLNHRLRGDVYCVGASLWKRSVLKPFLRLPACRVHFVSSLKKLQSSSLSSTAKILIWGAGQTDLLNYAQQEGFPILRVEDGFIRSVGLGSNLTPPLSLVIDDMGIYFNAQHSSRLEYILLHTAFSSNDKHIADVLQEKLIQAHISKYNVGAVRFTKPQTTKRLLLVPGQVEDDASIRYGTSTIQRNIDLLKQVRALNPDAYIIFKPHPDVVSGNRIGHIPEQETLRYADQIELQADILSCLAVVDEVHTMTSLTGFEALLRGKKVHCYGMPFYAGWGLTQDAYPCERRTRKLDLWQLIAGALYYYPLYIDLQDGHIIDATQAIDCLIELKHKTPAAPIQQSFIQKQRNKLSHLYKTIRKTI